MLAAVPEMILYPLAGCALAVGGFVIVVIFLLWKASRSRIDITDRDT